MDWLMIEGGERLVDLVTNDRSADGCQSERSPRASGAASFSSAGRGGAGVSSNPVLRQERVTEASCSIPPGGGVKLTKIEILARAGLYLGRAIAKRFEKPDDEGHDEEVGGALNDDVVVTYSEDEIPVPAT